MWFPALLCSGSVVVAVACLVLGPLGLRPPSPFRLGFFSFLPAVSASMWPVARHFSGGVRNRRVRGVFSYWPFGGFLVVVGRCFRLGVTGFGGVVSRCSFGGPVGVAFGVAWLGGLPASCGVSARLRVCVTVSSVFLLSGCLAGARWWMAGGSPFLCFCLGFACSLPCLPWPGARTGRHSVPLTGSLLVMCLAASCATAPWVG